MADDESRSGAGKEAAEGLKAILQRIADFFDIFDLSFVVSGAVALVALGFWAWRAQAPMPPAPGNWTSAILAVVASYVLGALCFAMGRWFRMGWRSRRTEGGADDILISILKAHGLDAHQPFSDYLARADHRGEARLYVRLWAEVRQRPDLAASFYLLRRYWVMAATYDGLVVALMIWLLALGACTAGVGGAEPIDNTLAAIIGLALVALIVACRQEAGRYADYQMEELVASIASKREAN